MLESPRVPLALVVVPCHNEERRLDVAAFETFTKEQSEISFVFVDDGARAFLPSLPPSRRPRRAFARC
jgi:hypothetical protein